MDIFQPFHCFRVKVIWSILLNVSGNVLTVQLLLSWRCVSTKIFLVMTPSIMCAKTPGQMVGA
jgi:hypothetical protein